MLLFLAIAILTVSFPVHGEEVPSGSLITHHDDRLEVTKPGSKERTVIPLPDGKVASGSKQWIAWYYKTCLACDHGFTYYSSTWTVPALPTTTSNLAIFNGLQASPDGSSWNWILQPVLMRGTWMAGTTRGWGLTSVMCPAQGNCLWTRLVPTSPGNTIQGVVALVRPGPPYTFQVNITDLTAGTPTQVLLFESKYFAPWAYVSLEHNPAGNLKSCSQLPGFDGIGFYENDLQPSSVDSWSGAQNDLSCGITVENFVFGDGTLNITW